MLFALQLPQLLPKVASMLCYTYIAVLFFNVSKSLDDGTLYVL